MMYNTYLCAKYGVKIAGVEVSVEESDIELTKELVEKDKIKKNVLELTTVVESDTLEGRIEGKYRSIHTKDFKADDVYKFIVDVDPLSFQDPAVMESIASAKTIYVSVVMRLMPHFKQGTRTMDVVIESNKSAQKCFGGDTLQEFKSLHPGLYSDALDNLKYYLFTGRGTVLKVLEEGDPFELENVKALMRNAEQFNFKSYRNGNVLGLAAMVAIY